MFEAVPNFSEARPEVVDALCAAVTGAGARLLDRHSDADHNRSVLTFAGSAEAIARAAFDAAAVAVRDIDLTAHQGVHPRMGAVDVIPIVPLGDGSMLGAEPSTDQIRAAAEIARSLASRIGTELGLPAYLYGAASAPGRPQALREIRGDGFESLSARGEAFLAPDFGPLQLHPTAGAVAVGARMSLIAFNVLLSTDRVAVARRLARELRESSGGVPAVQALGLDLPQRGLAQVSTNLLDFRRSGIPLVLARLRQGADEEGVELRSAELVGLAPAAALTGLEDDPLPGLPGLDQSIEARLGFQ